MASLDGTDHTTLLSESKADYTGITLYNNCLYISDSSRRSEFRLFQAFTIYCNIYIKLATLNTTWTLKTSFSDHVTLLDRF